VISCDLHIHSCLSPCAESSMKPADLVGYAVLNGLELIALTDHNSARNCPAAAVAAREYGIGFIPGMEVTSSEDIHAVCLFRSVEDALMFDSYIYSRIPDIKNRPGIFGEQNICDENGNIIQSEPRLLITGTSISIMDLPSLAKRHNGICYPAHIDRDANGLLAILGSWPEDLHVGAAEVRDEGAVDIPPHLKIIRASDAHRPEDIFSADDCVLPLDRPDFDSLAAWICGRQMV
jgi:hypothetical protein